MEWFILLGILLIPLLFVILQYNTLVVTRNHCDEAWANIDTELKRRHDLIPNLVETVKGYAKHERELFEKIAALRVRCLSEAAPSRQRATSENEMVGLLERLFVTVENYPELKASRNFLELQKELVNTEDRIQAALRFYNGNIRENNNQVGMFPSNLIAKLFRFSTRSFFEIQQPRFRQTPDVRL